MVDKVTPPLNVLPETPYESDQVDYGVSPVDTEPTPVALSSDILNARVSRYNMALGANSPGASQLASIILGGGEDALRSETRQSIADRMLVRNQETLKNEIENNSKSVTPDIVNNILTRDMPDLVDQDFRADVTLENELAKRYQETAVNTSDILNRYGPELVEDPVSVARLNTFQKAMTARESFRRIAEDEQTVWDTNNVFTKAGSIGLTMLPLYQWWATANTLKAPSITGILPGSNVQDQYKYLYDLAQTDPKQASREARAAVEDIRTRSAISALEFARGLTTFGAGDEFLFNTLGVADAIGVGSTAKAYAAPLTGALFNVGKVTGRRLMSAAGLIDASGNVERAALAGALAKMERGATNVQDARYFDELFEEIPTIANPDAVISGSRYLSQEAQRKLEIELKGRAANLFGIGDKQLTRGNLEGAALQTAIRESVDAIRTLHPHVNQAVMDVRHIIPEQTITNTDHIAVKIGKPSATLKMNADGEYIAIALGSRGGVEFPSEQAARLTADKWYKLPEYQVVQHGSGYVIEVTRALDPTTRSVRDALVLQTRNETPRSFANTWASLLRNPDNLNSKDFVEKLKLSTYSGSGMAQELGRAVDSAFGNMKRWRKDDLEEFTRFVNHQRDVNGVNGNKRGVFSNDIGEFETHWHALHGKAPKESQTRAYFAYRQFNDFDYAFRNLQEYKFRSEQGRKMYGLELTTDATSDGVKTQLKITPKQGMFEGRLLNEVPWSASESANILVWNGKTNPTVINTALTHVADRSAIDQMLAGGAKLIHLSSDGRRNLRSFMSTHNVQGNDAYISYVVAPNVVETPLPFKIIPFRPGGHVLYGDGHVIRQPVLTRSQGRVERTYYQGDKGHLHFVSEREAREHLDHINRARELLKGPRADLDAYIRNNLSHVYRDTTDFIKVFHPRGGNFNPDIPMFVSRMGTSLDETIDLKTFARSPNDTIIKERDSVHNLDAQRMSNEFIGERDLDMMGVYNGVTRPADKIDALTTMVNATNKIMRERYLTDFKIHSAERYIAEFGHLFEAATVNEIRQKPIKWLTEPVYKKNVSREEKAAAENFRRSVVSLLGERSSVERYFDAARTSIAESVFNSIGERSYKIAHTALEMSALKDPIRFARSLAFQKSMGLLNPAQFIIQAQHILTLYGMVNPVTLTKAQYAGTLMRATELTNKANIIDHLAKISGWNPKHFKESYQAMKDTGYARVGREYANLGDFIEQGVIETKMGKVLEAGAQPFKQGETIIRFATWNTAYLEWRAKNPYKVFSAKDKAEVLNRADGLANNMSTASDAAIQKMGVAAIPLQFLSHQARLWENIWTGLLGTNKAWSRGEAVRAALATSALYGVPVGVGAMVGFAPIATEYRKHLLSKGAPEQSVTEEAVGKVLNDGVISFLLELSGNGKYNVGERLGPQGMTLFSDLASLDSDKMVKALFGPVGTMAKSVYMNSYPMYSSIQAAVNGENTFNIHDLVDLSKSISSASGAVKLYYALNYGKYITRNEGWLEDITEREAYISFLTGLTPQRITDAYLKIDMDMARREALKLSREEVVRNFRRGYREADQGNHETAQAFFKRASAHMELSGMSPQERIQVFKESLKDQLPLVVRAGDKFSRNDPKRYEAWVKEMAKRQLRLKTID